MSIYTNKSGTVTEIAPRLKRDSAIVTPLSAWTKKDGVLKKVWDRYLLTTHVIEFVPTRVLISELSVKDWHADIEIHKVHVELNLTPQTLGMYPNGNSGKYTVTVALPNNGVLFEPSDGELFGDTSMSGYGAITIAVCRDNYPHPTAEEQLPTLITLTITNGSMTREVTTASTHKCYVYEHGITG